MGVTYIAPAGTVTSPARLITKTITENNTYNAADEGANGYSSVTVNVEGGGGGGDFSTAEVTIINSSDHGIPIPLTAVVENNVLTAINPNIVEQLLITVPLYKGKFILFEIGEVTDKGMWKNYDGFITDGITNMTGSYENTLDWDNSTGNLAITGNCSITITDWQ